MIVSEQVDSTKLLDATSGDATFGAVKLMFPLGMIIMPSPHSPGRFEVTDLVPGGAAHEAGLRTRDLVRAVTSPADAVEHDMRLIYLDDKPELACLQAMLSNAFGPLGNGTVTLVIERPRQPPLRSIATDAAVGFNTSTKGMSDIDSLLEIFEAAPRSAAARMRIREIFEGLDVESTGRVPYAKVLDTIQAMWRGPLRLPRDRFDDFRNDAAGLLMMMDHDRDGAVTLDELIEFLATLASLSDSRTTPEETRAGYKEATLQQLLADKLAGLALEPNKRLGRLLRDFSDSIEMLSYDIRNNFVLWRKGAKGESISKLDVSLLKRSASDTLTYIPCFAVGMMPLTLTGHLVLFSLVKLFAPHLFPSSFSESRLELVRSWRKVRAHPDYMHWSLYGEGTSEELGEVLLSIFEATPGSSKAQASIRSLFQELDRQSNGTLTYGQVLGVVQAMWGGKINLPKEDMRDFRMDATSLMLTIDRDGSGDLTLGEFTEYLQTVVEVANAYLKADETDASTAEQIFETSSRRATVTNVQEWLVNGAKRGGDSVFMFGQDVRHAAGLILKALKGKSLSPLDEAMLRRCAKDTVSVVAFVAIVLFPAFSVFLKIFGIVLLRKSAPSLFPSAFRKSRRRLAQAWRAIASRQRRRVQEDWLAYEERPRMCSDDELQALLTASDAATRRQRIKDLFVRFDTGGVGTLTYGKVLSIVEGLGADVGGDSKSSKNAHVVSRIDAASLLMHMDRDYDGAVTLVEFSEYAEALVEAAAPGTVGPPRVDSDATKKAAESSDASAAGSGVSALQPRRSPVSRWLAEKMVRFREAAKKEVRDLVDSTAMFGRDIGHSVSLLTKPKEGDNSSSSRTEALIQKRTLRDLALFLPIGAIIVAPLTPVGTALVIAMLKRYVPAVVPSSFRESRLRLARAWRAVRNHASVQESQEEF
eukprot:TRINITY_DN1768_c0_g1_i1.p1 TRINITY_DN1768_c0_g1~~TRINITY_DN1768_c0_g1_i1.p1  ORF type:complete len:929 (+),score=145.41 TRINITY_DN1768_c0_g1_i1:328-3114(+)